MTSRLLVIAPHHDDEAIGCGGLSARLSASGWQAEVAVVFAPIEGSHGAAHQQRVREAEAAAAILGLTRIGDLDLPCRAHVPVETITWHLVEILRRARPRMLLVPHRGDRDPEHRITHQACVEALWLAASPLRAELGPAVPPVELVLGYEIWTPLAAPALTVDIAGFLDAKLRAIRCYDSQLASLDYAAAARGLAAYRGVLFGGCAFAESYSIIEAHESALSLAALR